MTLHARLAAASGASAAGAAALLLAQRFNGTVPAVLVMVVLARAAAPASALTAGEVARQTATAALRRHAHFTPVWVLLAAAASVRAGSTVLADVAGAHGVAGLALARGPVATVTGFWLCALAVAVAIAGTFTDPIDARAVAPAPRIWTRLEWLGVAVQIGFAAAMLAGPQIRGASDAIPWAVTAAALGTWSWFGRHAARLPIAPLVASAMGAAGLLLVIVGGRP